MNGGEIYVTRLSAWAPGIGSWALSSPGEWGEWNEWAAGARSISLGAKGPDIAFADSMFRRRLSQISKMTIQVIHDLLPLKEDTKIFFLSFRGELSRQYQINKMLIEEKVLSPAAFSLSVFNAPVALASMALGLKGGYTALYPGKNSFTAGIKAAEAALLCGITEELVFVYADEQAPPEYECFFQNCPFPAAFGLLLSRNSVSQVSRPFSIPLSSLKKEESPLDFFRQILLRRETYASS
jgi:hypothetical protein